MDVWGSRRFRFRGAVALTGVAALAIAMGSCGSGTEQAGPEAVVDQFTELLDEGDHAAAAELTSYPSAASATLEQMFDGLESGTVDYEKAQFIGLDAETGIFRLDVNWNFGERKDWSYGLEGTVRKLSDGWKISWDPAVVMPQLEHDRTVQLVRTTPDPAPRVVDNIGKPLMTEQTINVIQLDPARMPDPVASTDALSRAIEPVAPLITGASLREKLAASGGKPITAVSLREGDFAILEPEMAPIPGVVMKKEPRLIVSDRRVFSPLLDAMTNVWEDNQEKHSGWAVQLFENGQFVKQLAGYQGPAGPDIAGTMDQRLQRAAEDAVVSVGSPASIVVTQPSTGAVVAAAQNNYSSALGPVAFTGLYPVGGMMELFRAVAGASEGKAAKDVSDAEAVEAAAALGVGVDFRVPGLDEVTGRPAAAGDAEPVRQGGGSDALLASPFGMAIAAAAIGNGTLRPPMIERGRPGETDAPTGPLPGPVADAARRVLRDGMNAPQMARLRGFRDVTGYSAKAGDDGWLIATMGDLAFAIHIVDVDSGDMVVRMGERMLASFAEPEE
ncbi:NTF2-like N-terminal transpeptidase domain-containing protein [Nocardia flavorosea]|uniref:NTF2-like N-terminal transpeptidase domain-containing protein n=1 Tax=Nocardia flavorosea TaxID=53429 RepID=UPI001E2882A9|nr:NTF2-like N-terminal transpeptidase domain-containing protein [Nocardia flavorosea]